MARSDVLACSTTFFATSARTPDIAVATTSIPTSRRSALPFPAGRSEDASVTMSRRKYTIMAMSVAACRNTSNARSGDCPNMR